MEVVERIAVYLGYGVATIYLLTGLMMAVARIGLALGLLDADTNSGAVRDFLRNFH